jgi:Right handed beta helix region
MLRIVTILASLVFASLAPAQVRIHVLDGPVQLEEGSDTAPTIEAALERLAAARAAGDVSPATIYLAHRTYRITRPIELNAALVAEGLTLQASPSCKPVISGGVPIEGFEVQPNGTWRVTLPAVRGGEWWFEQLFVDGRRATRARHPNGAYARVVEAGPDNRTSFTFDPAELPPALVDGLSEVVLLHDWSSSRVRIQAVDPATHTITTANPIGCAAPHYRITNFEPHPRFFIEGSPRLVDVPGEWALERETGILTYMPLPGQSIDKLEVIAPRAPALLRATGTPEAPLRNLHLRGIRFAHTAWPIPSYGYAEGQAAFYEKRDVEGSGGTRDGVPAAIEFAWCEDSTIEHSVIESAGASGLWLGAGCHRCTVDETVVRDVGGNGILIGETAGRTVQGKTWWQAAPEQAASSNTVRRSLIERCGQRFFGAVGLWIGLAQGTTVERNEVRDLPYTGISVGWRWDETPTPCRTNLIAGNHIHAVMQTLSDGGGIYILGRQPGTVLRSNAIHDIRRNAGRAPSNGIFFDQGTSETLTEANVFWDIDTTPLRWHWTYKNRVAGNTFVLGEGQAIARYNRAQAEDIDYADNTTVAEADRPPDLARTIIDGAGPGRE